MPSTQRGIQLLKERTFLKYLIYLLLFINMVGAYKWANMVGGKIENKNGGNKKSNWNISCKVHYGR